MGEGSGQSVLCPTALRGPHVAWRTDTDDDHAVAEISVGGFVHPLSIEVDGDGRIRGARLPRWGAPDGGPFGMHTFSVALEGEISSGGCTIPASVRAGWQLGENGRELGDFFRATIDAVVFR